MEHLKLSQASINEVTLENGYKCKSVDLETKNSIWYPTSEQLRSEFGIQFRGGVCADNAECYEYWLTRSGNDEDSFAVGNIEFVVDK